MIIEGIVFLLVLLFWWNLEDKKKYVGYPPGPPRFPVLGNLPQLLAKFTEPALAFEELAKTYGDVMFLNIGQLDAVVFSSHKTVTDILNHDKSASRACFKIPVARDRVKSQNLGIIFSNDEVWLTIRRFTLRNLRDFGFGKTLSMDFVINEELNKLTNHLDKLIATNSSGIVRFDSFFDLTVVNVLWRLVTGVNYSLDDPRMRRLLKLSNDQVQSTNFAFDLSIAFPILRDWFPYLFGKSNQLKIIEDLHQFGRDTINEHRSSGNYSVDPKGFVDIFLEKIDDFKEDSHPHFNDDQLLITILDLFQAGGETTSKTLAFGVMYMLLHPKVQEKVQKEIDSVVPEHAFEHVNEIKRYITSLIFCNSLPYSFATLLEILRYSTVVPFPPMREASEDFYFEGHFIKKGTALMPNIHAAHFSKEIWGDPEEFRPERFLAGDGSVDSKMENYVIPFGGGKRICVGKNLAESNLFLYFTSLLRRYSFSKVPGTVDPSIVPILGITSTPQPFDAQVKRRVSMK